MTDIAIRMVDLGGAGLPAFDLSTSNADLLAEEGLESAVIVSLFTDRRATESDLLPDGSDDRRGWWGDVSPPVAEDRIGSRLWLLWREKITAALLTRAEEYAREALAWLIEDGVASAVDVTAERYDLQTVALSIIITRANGRTWATRWEYQIGAR